MNKRKKAAIALAARQALLKNPSPCPDCSALKEQLRVAHVTIKYLQQQTMKMASQLVG